MPETTTATFCATLTDEWILQGIRHAVIAPGSRSTPLALALTGRAELDIHVVHDERAAAFLALGIGLSTGRPAVLLCTSGTAATHFHAAIVEAHQAEVPMIVTTADRPPELRDTGAPQTIDQWGLYGSTVRWFHDPGVPSEEARHAWRAIAARAAHVAVGARPGPVHLNLPFREPLVGDPAELPAAVGARGLRTIGGHHGLHPDEAAVLVELLDRQRGIIVVGGGPGVREAASAIHRVAEQLNWPVLADHRSGCRIPRNATVAAFDAILRHDDFASAHTPEVVLQIGGAPASKVLAQWIAGSGADLVQVQATDSWLDPAQRLAMRVVAEPTAVVEALDGRVRGATNTPWLARWRRAEARAQTTIDAALTDGALSEPAVSRTLTRRLADGSQLVVSSSMPVRDLEWFGLPHPALTVYSNRGANGIDGVVSTSLGVALGSGRPTVVLIGDLALVHDSTALIAASERRVDLTIVVTDNDGGGIFSFLPQATALTDARFEQLFATPHGTDFAMLAATHHLEYRLVSSITQLEAALAESVGPAGIRLLHVRTSRRDNVDVHRELNAAVAAALG